MLNVILVDDEKKASATLKNLLARFCPDVQVLQDYQRIETAYHGIQERKPDLVFLDIELPDGSGFDLLGRFDNIEFDVIFITAYNEYAIKAFKYSAIDYLLKPVDIDELVHAVSKVERINSRRDEKYKVLLGNVNGTITNKLSVPIKGGLAFVNLNNIIRLEADGAYTVIIESGGIEHRSTRYLKEYEAILDSDLFLRVHISHIINLDKVKSFSRVDGFLVEMEDGSRIELSRRKKDEFFEKLRARE
jgi:two-component system, LytTR family, response regulator